MSNKSDNNNQPHTNIFELLPEVHRSETNETLFETAFNRHLTKDNLTRVSGFIGQKNPQALVNRQIKEPSTYRQAYQLQPAMHTKVGSVDNLLTQPGFLEQLRLMGVDIDRLKKWGSTDQFNWIPPVNIDMLTNYSDYFWPSTDPADPAQYITIENRCNKARSKSNAYENAITRKGILHAIDEVDPRTNTFVVKGNITDILTTGVIFFTKNTTNVNIADSYWTVSTSSYDQLENETSITTIENIAINAEESTPPTSTVVGRWWYAPDTNKLYIWNGTSWVQTAVFFSGGDVSLSELLLIYQRESNCACNEDFGWDMAQWDDNQDPAINVLWNEALLATISSPTAPVSPSALDLWYDTTEDRLNQWDQPNTAWAVVANNFSSILVLTTGDVRWDSTVGCESQILNQWSEQNKWIHKAEISTFGNVKRAQLPILEFNSTIEQNEWIKVSHAWKYRPTTVEPFISVDGAPSRFELEPIKDYGAYYDTSNNKWYVYLFTNIASINRDIDHTATFVPGTKIRFIDDVSLTEIYTVARSEFRKIGAGDQLNTDPVYTPPWDPSYITDYYVTVVELEETIFTPPLIGGGPTNIRIEPVVTSFGDSWAGYHAHWVLDVNNTTRSPVGHQQLNPFITETTTGTYYNTSTGLVTITAATQEFTATVAGVTSIDLDPSFHFDPSESRFYATPNSNDLRVYLNGVRQYGTYVETVDASTQPNYTLIGTSATHNTVIQYVNRITFLQPLNQYDIVRIEVAPASFSDMGMFSVPVRTVEDESAFTSGVISGSQPVYRSLVSYQRIEQIKTATNQYPLFNVYDVCTAEIRDASPLFVYEEKPENPIHPDIGRRITSIDGGRDYTFIQYLLDRNDNMLYGYKNLDNAPFVGTFWYNRRTAEVKIWDGYTWNQYAEYILPGTSGSVFRIPIVADEQPSVTHDVTGILWLNVITEKLYQWNGINWNEITDVLLSDSDPLIQTVWKTTNDDAFQYVPKYVNENREEVPVGDPSGTWEMLDQWYYNPEHKNKEVLNYSELVTHLSSVLSSNLQTSGLYSGGVYSLSQNEFDYGLGGTIKEHNYSFDTLVSAVNVKNISPVGLLEWIEDQYSLTSLLVRDEFNRNITTVFSDYSLAGMLNLTETIIPTIVEEYQKNDFVSLVYGDTTAYNSVTDVGMPNWPASASIVGLQPVYKPHMLVDTNFVELFHHDGHRSRIYYTPGERDRYAKQIINVTDPRVGNQTLGKQGSGSPPATHNSFLTTFGGINPRPGVYWYQIVGGVNKLFRFSSYTCSTSDPSFFLDGNEIPDGTQYYNITNKTTYIKNGLSWDIVGSFGSGVLSTLWEEIDFAEYVGEILLDIETRLYEITPQRADLVFDYNTLTTNVDDIAVYNEELEKRFYAFVAEREITAPLVNSQYQPSDAFTWNYVNSNILTIPPTSSITAPQMAASWQELYTRWYNTPYPHLEPWKLQGFNDKPDWWDEEYLEIDGSRRWVYDHNTTTGMWENIRVGRVPTGKRLPNGNVSTGSSGQAPFTYNYFSVNIADVAVDGYQPDSILPPYFNDANAPTGVRSLFTMLSSEVSAPNADYTFGDGGPTEWQWKVSSEYVYDIPIIAFIMQPVRFLHSSFGVDFITVDRLHVDTIGCQVYSHEDAMFHGDIYDTNKVYVANGLNQWYVNYNRFSGHDTNTEFRSLWAGWDPKLSYSFAGIIDNNTFDITTKYFDITDEDYNVILANTGVFKEMWSDGFNVKLLSIPPSIIQYNNQSSWRFDLSTLMPVSRTLFRYGVKQYPFTVNINSDVCTLYRYQIIDASAVTKQIFVAGNHTSTFAANETLTITESSTNDGSYTVVSSVFEPSANRTRINVAEVVPSSIGDGIVDITGMDVTWQLGQRVVISSNKLLPAPLVEGESYFIIPVGGKSFKLAESVVDANNGVEIDFTTLPQGELLIGEVESSFYVYGRQSNSKEMWYHYVIDKGRVISEQLPTTIVGMQNLINIIDGYAEYQKDTGLDYNSVNHAEFDETTGRPITWSYELERFIDWAYNIRRTNVRVNDKYGTVVNGTVPTNELSFSSGTSSGWKSGTPIVFTTTGTLPSPLIPNTPYYFVQGNDPGVFHVSITSTTSNPATYVTLTSTGVGEMFIAVHKSQIMFPSFEINPARNNIWINTPLGVLSDVIAGPYADIFTNQTIFDQYGRALDADKLNFFRNDLQTHIGMRPGVEDDINIVPAPLRTQYDYLHMGGGHFFIEGYEHVLLFNDYTTDGSLMYDQFLGLNTSKFNLDYYEGQNYTLRPTLGGHYMVGGEFERNIEGSIVDIHNYYDTYDLRQGSIQAPYARNLVGYQDDQPYLDLVNMNDQSQFLFYRGMIQHKGSVAGAKAYINSRRFIDAKIDEFWAWKIAEFGDSRSKIYPEVKLFSEDSLKQDVLLHFLSPDERLIDSDVVQAIDEEFVPVEWTDDTRWEIYPEQRDEIGNPMFLTSQVSSMWTILIDAVPPISGQEDRINYWIDSSNAYVLKSWDGSAWNVVTNNPIKNNVNYIKLDQPFDTAYVLHRTLINSGNMDEFITEALVEDTDFTQINSEVIKIDMSVFNGILMLFTLNPSVDKNNPSKIVDKKSRVALTNAQLWDPARNIHSSRAIHSVDFSTSTDIAKYFVSMDSSSTSPDNIWNNVQVGKVWFDTGYLGYKRYYDTSMYPDTNDRLNRWGVLSDWADVKVYEWTSSSVPPNEWEDLVTQHESSSLPQREKATGVAKQTLFKRTRSSYSGASVQANSITGASQVGVPVTVPFVNDDTNGYCDVLFTGGSVADGNPTGLSVIGPGPYQANVNVDGTSYLISVTDISASTYSSLKSQIAAQLLNTALITTEAGNTRIRITSASKGTGSKVRIQDINLFSSLAAAPSIVQSPIDGSVGTAYTQTVLIDGTSYGLSINGDNINSLANLATEITSQLGANVGYATVDGSNIKIFSAKPGTDSSVSIVTSGSPNPIFSSAQPMISGTYGKVTPATGTFSVDDVILFTSSNTLPEPLQQGVKYTITDTTSGLTVADDGDPVNIITAGSGTFTIVEAFSVDDWKVSSVQKETQYGAIDFVVPAANPTISLTNPSWEPYDIVDVFVNDVLVISKYELDNTLTIPFTNTTIYERDFIDIVRNDRVLTSVEEEFDPDNEDDGTMMVQWKYDYQYSYTTRYNGTVPITTYFFWVEGSQRRSENDTARISGFEAAQQLRTIPTPYFVVQHPKWYQPSDGSLGWGLLPWSSSYGSEAMTASPLATFLDIPVYYRQAILRNGSSYINEDSRFVWQFTYDMSLRLMSPTNVNRKNKHQEWKMFRREQTTEIDRELWDRLTESIVGYKLTDNTIRVPSLERELYDAANGTDTRYGLGIDQAFCNGQFALETILSYLQDPNNDFGTIDIDMFFATHSFDTPQNIEIAMNTIYLTFSAQHINNMWFETLYDALTTRAKYKELMKTSWLALHGIRVLEVAGVFDD